MKVLHFTSWLFKDIFWSLKWTWMATFMVIPTIFFTIYFLVKEKDQKMEKGSNGTKQPCQPNIEQSERETSLPQREGP